MNYSKKKEYMNIKKNLFYCGKSLKKFIFISIDLNEKTKEQFSTKKN